MRRVCLTHVGSVRLFGALGLALAVMLALTWAATAAQAQSFKAQYGKPVAPSGPAAGATCGVVQSDDDLLNAGDFVSFKGNYSVASGSSLVLEDSDGTQGTFIDGKNAGISTGDKSNIEVSVTGDPLNVTGGDGVLSSNVCDFVVTTTGVSASGASGGGSLAAIGVLPDTGGPAMLALIGGLAAASAGLAVHRLRTRGR